MDAASDCQSLAQSMNTRCRNVRHQNLAVCVAAVYRYALDETTWAFFVPIFKKKIKRPPKSSNKVREVFLFMEGESNLASSGTDAKAMAEAIRQRIPAAEIPKYIKDNQGIDRLLREERERNRPEANEEKAPLATHKVVHLHVPAAKVDFVTALDVGQTTCMRLVMRPSKATTAVLELLDVLAEDEARQIATLDKGAA